MADVIKQFQESVFDKMPADQGPADKKFVAQSDMGIPITKAQEIIQGNQPWATDLPLAPFQSLGNKLFPGQPFGKENRWLMNEEQKKFESIISKTFGLIGSSRASTFLKLSKHYIICTFFLFFVHI